MFRILFSFTIASFITLQAWAAPCMITGKFQLRKDGDEYRKLTFKTKKTQTVSECVGFAARILDRSQRKFKEKDVLVYFKNQEHTLKGWALQRYTQSVKASTRVKPKCNIFIGHYVGEYGYSEEHYPETESLDECVRLYEKGTTYIPNEASISGAYLSGGYLLWFPTVEHP